MFLREVANFRRLSAAGADEDICFQMFLAIVSEFVESGSTFEVNISVEAKDEIMGYFDEAIFTGLDKVTLLQRDARPSEFVTSSTEAKHVEAVSPPSDSWSERLEPRR